MSSMHIEVSFEGSPSYGQKGLSPARITREVGEGSIYTMGLPFDTAGLLRISMHSNSVRDSFKAFTGFGKTVASKFDLSEF